MSDSTEKKRVHALLAITLMVSFCSIVYELMLAQCLSIVLGNTIVRYALTIGLYLFSLGMGALAVAYLQTKKTPEFLFAIEIILAFLGMQVPFAILGGDQVLRELWISLGIARDSFWFWFPNWFYMHGMIVVIGLLSGAEVPILMDLAREHYEEASQKVLAVDYLGTFLGALAFPLFIYEQLGLIAGAAAVGVLNALAALWVLYLYPQTRRKKRYVYCTLSLVGMSFLFFNEEYLRNSLMEFVFGRI